MQKRISSRRIISSLKAEEDRKRKPQERIADFLTRIFGSITFLILNIIWFTFWIVMNLGLISGFKPFDPYPFNLLTMTVSLEAICLAVIVLISQNRASKVDDLREEVDLQVDIITEEELTKLMKIVEALAKKQGIDTAKDTELQEMLEPTNLEKIKRVLEREVEEI